MTIEIHNGLKTAWRTLGPDAGVIILLTFMAYLPVTHGGFVFDDYQLITGNRIVRASDGLYRFWCTTESPDYWPVTSSAWWFEWRLWGNNAAGYHVVNVLLHAVNAVLLWFILRRLKIPGAWPAALVFAVHPVNVATVAWISEQKNTLSMLFTAVAILLYLRFDEESRLPRTLVRGWRWYGLSLAAFLLALLSKTAVVMLPVVLLGCVWWRRGRMQGRDLLNSAPFFLCSLVLGLLTIWFQQKQVTVEYAVENISFLSRLAAAGWAPWFYLSKVFLPLNLSMIYPKWNVNASLWISYLPGLALLGCFAILWWKRKTWGRPLLFGLGYFVVMFFPVLGFFHQSFHRYSWVADHWQYSPIIGVIALVVAAGDGLARRTGERGRSVGTLAIVVLLAALVMATWRRSNVYQSNETLWRDNVAKHPNVFLAHNNLGAALWQAGRRQEAVEQFEQALRIDPDSAMAHTDLGVALLSLGKTQEAIRHFEQALRANPNYAVAQNNLGNALLQLGRLQEAIGHLDRALQLKPDYADPHYNLGAALERTGKTQEAIGHYEQALRINPNYAAARSGLARLRAAQ